MLIDSFQNFLLLEFLKDFSLVLNQITMSEWEVIYFLLSLFLFDSFITVLMLVNESLISLNKGFSLDFNISCLIFLLLLEFGVVHLNQLGLVFLSFSLLRLSKQSFLVDLLLQVSNNILILTMVKYDALCEAVTRLTLDQSI